MTFTLERIIYGTSDTSDEMSILAISDHLTPQDAALWRGITSLKPMDAPIVQGVARVRHLRRTGRSLRLGVRLSQRREALLRVPGAAARRC